MKETQDLRHAKVPRLRWPIRLTFMGMLAERVVRCFWPLWSVVLAALASLMLGTHDLLPLEAVWIVGTVVIAAFLGALVFAVGRFRWPSREEVVDRLDRTIPGRPIAAISDVLTVGAGDAGSEAVWQAHLARMAERLKDVRAAEPDLTLSRRDPFALRYVALLAFTTALLFGSVLRVASVAEIAPGGGSVLAQGPAWEGWIEPPRYTGRPSIYLNDVKQSRLAVPEGSRVTLRFYGEVGALALQESVSERTHDVPAATDPVQSFDIIESGTIRVDGPGGREWQIDSQEDMPPAIEFDGTIARGQGGRMEAPFLALDDYGVTGGRLEIVLDLDQVDRRYGLSAEPELREKIVLDLPMTITGDRTEFGETAIDDFSKHPWANLPVTAELVALDAAGQEGLSAPQFAELPGRRFFDPMAKSIVEQRRDLLWNRVNGQRVAQVLRAVSYKPEDIFRSETVYMKLRFAVRRLETRLSVGRLDDASVEELADVLWDIALEVEEGDLSDALQRLRRAQDRLAEAIENGATNDEIAQLMQELREAMQDYMRQLAENQGDQQNQDMAQGDQQEITGQELQDMLDRLQQLMEEGRMAEAQQLLDQLRQMMENMQIARGQPGQQGPGQQALQGLAETLRQQQGLSDEAFRDLQEQFGQEGQNGSGQDQGDEGQQSQDQRQGQDGQNGQGSLADRQQALRQELGRQVQNLPGAGTPEGDAARESLGRAGEAMDNAEEALRNEDFAGALDDQAEAIEALREGMRGLADQLAQQQQNQQGGQQGNSLGRNNPDGTRDPLGRDVGENGRIGTDEQLLQGDDVYRRARELLDEIRRRSGEQSRPSLELDYLKRLLDRF